MASTIKVTPQKEKIPEEVSETPPDRPVLDFSDAAVKALIRTAKQRGYVTHDQINALLSSEEVNSEQIENILVHLTRHVSCGISLFRRALFEGRADWTDTAAAPPPKQ